MKLNLISKKSKETLDIMFYDASDWAGEQLRLSWVTGGLLYRLFGQLDEVRGCLSWEEALEYLLHVRQGEKINSIQFWGHGSPGHVWIDGRTLSLKTLLPNSVHRHLLEKLKSRLHPNSVLWFRSCNVGATTEGKEFTKALSEILECRIAVHTHVVHLLQGGLHILEPGQEPSWPSSEGVHMQSGGILKMLWTMPWTKNNVFFLQSNIPEKFLKK